MGFGRIGAQLHRSFSRGKPLLELGWIGLPSPEISNAAGLSQPGVSSWVFRKGFHDLIEEPDRLPDIVSLPPFQVFHGSLVEDFSAGGNRSLAVPPRPSGLGAARARASHQAW